MKLFQHILVPTDFGPSSKAALDLAVEMAIKLDARITLLHVCEIPTLAYGMELGTADLFSALSDAAEKELESLRVQTARRIPGIRTESRIGFPRDAILSCATTIGADLIVMGTHGRRGLPHALLGSVAERVVRLSKVPVLTVRGPR